MDPKKLYRSNSNKVFTGVCGGVGEYFSIDPVLVRLVWVAAALFSLGVGFWGYVFASLIIPIQSSNSGEVKSHRGCLYVLLILLLASILASVTISVIAAVLGFWGHSFLSGAHVIRQWM